MAIHRQWLLIFSTSYLFTATEALVTARDRQRVEIVESARAPKDPCMSSLADLHSFLSEEINVFATERVGADFRFYLHDTVTADFVPSAKCYLDQVGAKFGVDDLDDHIKPTFAEHMTDYWLLQRLAEHPARTFNEQEASLHIIGAPATTSYQASTLDGSPCGTLDDHYKRMEDLTNAISQMQSFQDSQGSNFLIENSFYYPLEVFGIHFGGLLENSYMVVASVDIYHGLSSVLLKRHVVTPYKPHHITESAAWQSAIESEVTNTFERNIDFMFHGNMERDNAGSLRFNLFAALGEAFNNTSFHNSEAMDVDDDYAWTRDTANTMLRTRFCVVPEGDSTTTRRLFDAVAAGCVPILFAGVQQMSHFVPFRKSIDWSEIAVFAGSTPCALDNITSTVDMLQHLLDDPVREQQMRHRGQAAFRGALSYSRGHGLVSALLAEMDAQASIQHGSWVSMQHSSQLPTTGAAILAPSPAEVVSDPEAPSAHYHTDDDNVPTASFAQTHVLLTSSDQQGWHSPTWMARPNPNMEHLDQCIL